MKMDKLTSRRNEIKIKQLVVISTRDVKLINYLRDTPAIKIVLHKPLINGTAAVRQSRHANSPCGARDVGNTLKTLDGQSVANKSIVIKQLVVISTCNGNLINYLQISPAKTVQYKLLPTKPVLVGKSRLTNNGSSRGVNKIDNTVKTLEGETPLGSGIIIRQLVVISTHDNDANDTHHHSSAGYTHLLRGVKLTKWDLLLSGLSRLASSAITDWRSEAVQTPDASSQIGVITVISELVEISTRDNGANDTHNHSSAGYIHLLSGVKLTSGDFCYPDSLGLLRQP